jgi:Cysteine-rich secretory protein family
MRLPHACSLVLAMACASGCTGNVIFAGSSDDADPSVPLADASPGAPDSLPPLDTGPSVPDAATLGNCDDISGDRRQQVCLRWKCDRADRSEGTWTGSVDACEAGEVTDGGREHAIKLINMYRFIAGLPPVMHEPGRDLRAQLCALMMDANDQLSHAPPSSWTCYTPNGAMGAGQSNIASAPGVQAVDMYMNDFGNDTTIGHRRWLLSNSLGPIGLGSTSSASCALVIGGNGHAGKPWLAWPPPGPVPFEAFHVGGFGRSLDESGWSLQSDSLDLDSAQVSVSDGGQSLPVTTTVLGQGFGSSRAIRFVTSGWSTQAGHTYHVRVSGVSMPIEYDVEVVDCP